MMISWRHRNFYQHIIQILFVVAVCQARVVRQIGRAGKDLLLQRGGTVGSPSSLHYPCNPPPETGIGASPPDATVREGDYFHLPLAALRHGLVDALAWNEAVATGSSPPGTRPPPEFLTKARASFFFGESNGTTFAALRQLYGLSNREYLDSFGSGFDVFSSNSKSRQFFCFTRDKRFIIKTMSSEEILAMSAILGDYWKHMAANPRSLLVHYCGHYHVRLYRYETDEWEDVHFLVMQNLMLPPRPGLVMTELYDVKGSTVGRAASEKDKAKETKILKDLDLMQRPYPLDLGSQKSQFMAQAAQDVDFLRAMGVMDYSLLLGVCPTVAPQGFSPQRVLSYFHGPTHRAYPSTAGGWVLHHPQGREVYVTGLIDILQLYNRRKKAETLLKSVVYNRHAISAVDPALYASRFLNFLDNSLAPLPPSR